MEIAVQSLFGMLLSQQSEGADALHNVVLPAVGREGVVDGERGDGGNGVMERWSGGVMFFESFETGYFEVKAIGEEGGEGGIGAHREETVRRKFEVARSLVALVG